MWTVMNRSELKRLAGIQGSLCYSDVVGLRDPDHDWSKENRSAEGHRIEKEVRRWFEEETEPEGLWEIRLAEMAKGKHRYIGILDMGLSLTATPDFVFVSRDDKGLVRRVNFLDVKARENPFFTDKIQGLFCLKVGELDTDINHNNGASFMGALFGDNGSPNVRFFDYYYASGTVREVVLDGRHDVFTAMCVAAAALMTMYRVLREGLDVEITDANDAIGLRREFIECFDQIAPNNLKKF